MRNAVIGFISLIILVISGLSILTIHNKSIRENELDTNLGMAMEQSLASFAMDKEYVLQKKSEDLLVADMIQNLLLKTTSNSEFTVHVLTANTQKGILDVKVVETFPQFGGIKGHAYCRKTVVLEEYKNKKEEFFPVSFIVFDQCVKSVWVYGGSTLQYQEPISPKQNGNDFLGWKLEDTGKIYKDISFITVIKPLTFRACFPQER
ncbi:MAG: hypothetical protein RSD97_06435 [Lachnospiraceae bacterium]